MTAARTPIRQVNLPADSAKSLIAAIARHASSSSPPTKDLFADARKEIRDLIKRDTLPRFRKIEPFLNLVDTLNAHEEAYVFETDEDMMATVDRAAQQALAFPKYAHSVTKVLEWQTFEVDM